MRVPRSLRLPLFFAPVYAIVAAGGLALGVGADGGIVAWPAGGLTLVALLCSARRDWVPLLATVAVVELAIDSAAGFPAIGVAGVAATNVLEPWLGAMLYRAVARSVEPPDLSRPRDALRLGAAVILAPALANVLAACAVVAGDMTEVSRATAWLSFTAADSVGIVTTLPFFLAIAERRARWSPELLVTVAATACAAAIVFLFGDGVHLYLAALPLLWAAIRMGPFGASTTSIGLVVTSAFLTGRGQGPFGAQSVDNILDLQVALVSLEVLVIATAVVGGALARERDAAGQQAGSFERILSSLHSVVLTGHAAGDDVLRELARRFTSLVRQTDERRAPDLVARWGGEEFCALISGVADPAIARAAGERIREATVAAPFRLAAGTEIAVTVSAGVAVGTGSIEHLVDEADRALYTAKRRGRDQVRLFTDLGPADLVPGDSDAVRLAQALAFAVETREGAQDLHSRHVSDLSGAVAAHLGLPDAMVERCRLAGWLHDVGKLTIPDAVVAVDGDSGPAEQEIMKTHATIGDQLVSTMPGLAEAHLGVRHHHERYDGTGYPDGLAGSTIPLEARIVAAADLFSTLTARGDVDRVTAIAAVQHGAGSQLDPQVVAALVAVLLDETRAIATRFGTAA